MDSDLIERVDAALAARVLPRIPDFGASLEGLNALASVGEPPVALESGQMHVAEGVSFTGRTSVSIRGTGAGVFIGARSHLHNCHFEFRGRDAWLVIGADCVLRNVRFGLNGNDALMAVGDTATWQSGTALCNDGRLIVIGNDSMLSNEIVLRTDDGHGIFDLATQARINAGRDIVLHRHVWLGNGVRVNKGADVGAGSVVGQQGIVSGRLEAKGLYAGAPARLIRSDIGWSRSFHFDGVPEDLR